ncbi:MAG: DNA mismatch repair protein MutS [Myxococcales bacterium]|jgi:DNA mismatch repair protein MutS
MGSGKKGRRSPAMQQFFRAKEAHPDALLFFRMGDFYELFYEDAVLAADLLDIALTSRGNDEHGVPIPMAGVPHHAAAGYIARLIEQGQRVAVCEQMEDPSKVKGVVPREVVRVITPGLVLEPDALDARSHNYLASIAGEGPYGLCVLELSTSDARACRLDTSADVLAELVRLDAREVLLEEAAEPLRTTLSQVLPRAAFRALSPDLGELARERDNLADVLDAAGGQGGFGELELRAAAGALGYAQRSQPGVRLDVQRLAPYDPSDHLLLDDAAVRNLELVSTLSGERRGSLLHLLDESRTAMGARLLRRRILAPLTDLACIRRRHDHVEALLTDAPLREAVREDLSQVADLERLCTRAALGVATPRDLGVMESSLRAAESLRQRLRAAAERSTDDALTTLVPEDTCDDLRALLGEALVDEPPVSWTGGGIFREEHDPRVAELRQLSSSGKDVILELEAREREKTGIPTLKIRFTKVFGYYIEVSKARLAGGGVPENYRRKQTVATAERFTTDELDEVQTKILNADERLRALEGEMFEKLRDRVGAESPRLKRLSENLASLDVHAGFAELAHRHGYVRPELDEGLCTELVESRHPIVEQHVEAGRFVPNDVRLHAEAPADGDGATPRMMIITGPNMAGKSTAMRQVALCVIMAQAGGFVPAASARMGLVDRIYTRVGASDNVAAGESTFMVEMRETASILRGATRRSLVVLDEIGRGTSTYDGLAIAWAVAEHLHDVVGCRTMFATHYHELCELSRTRPGVANFNVAAKEYGEEVVFLHKLVPGGANRSYGVAVARLAGVPELVLARARAMLRELESGGALPSGAPATLRGKGAGGDAQLDMFAPPPVEAPESQVDRTLRELDVERMTPVEALVALARLKELLPPD